LKAIILFGPTASGKTALMEELFCRKKICPAEIISADSMQVYRGMDIGTAKPSPEDRAKIRHHLIDIRDPCEQFNAGEFVRLASLAMEEAAVRGSLPVISGGTGFYLRNLVLGLPQTPPSDAGIRSQLQEEAKQKGAAALMARLAACDPVSAGRIHINDEYRLVRALEVFRVTGRPLSSFAINGVAVNGPSQDSAAQTGARRQFLILGLRRPREELYRRVDERCKQMFSAGLPEEVRGLFRAGYTPDDPGLKAIGYREFFVVEAGGENSRLRYRLSEDLSGVEALVAQNSRRYAKRQITFFSSIPGVHWIDCGPNAAKEVERHIGRRDPSPPWQMAPAG
jgi:tRNA dimethylallyltransferase